MRRIIIAGDFPAMREYEARIKARLLGTDEDETVKEEQRKRAKQHQADVDYERLIRGK